MMYPVATMDWLYPLSGFVVGAIVGLTGMGGGSLMTPLLILLFGVHPLTAVGTDLLYAAVTKTAGTAIHSKKGNVDWRVAGLLAAGSVPATVLTIWVLSRVPKQSPTTATIISVSMGVVLIIAAVAIFFRRRIRDYALARADNPTRTRHSGPITVVFGAVLGVLVSLYSVGAGALGVAVLFFLYPRLPPARIVGSDLDTRCLSPLWPAWATGSSAAWIGTLLVPCCSVPCRASRSVATWRRAFPIASCSPS
jgi:uncharacterized membrane protein YfcA